MEEDQALSLDEFIASRGQIVDLRTPLEYERGHIPTAINIPIFTDEERKEVGKAFKLQGPFKATQLGLKYVGPKLSEIITLLKENGKFPIKVYCSRGGMRSQSMVWLLNFCRLSASSLRKGYKSYRRWSQDAFSSSFNFHLIQPSLGAPIQECIERLKKKKKQVLDLAEISKSSIGFLMQDESPQPTSEHFENLLAYHLNQLDHSLPIWVQNVGKEMGQCKMPQALLKHFKVSPPYLINSEKEKRIEALANAVQAKQKNQVISMLTAFKKKLGPFKSKKILDAFNQKEYQQVAEILTEHFDKIAFFYLKKHKGNLISYSENEFAAL